MERKAKPRITFYSDMNGPHEEQVRENARRTPEECWEIYRQMRRLYVEFTGNSQKLERGITISTPSWM